MIHRHHDRSDPIQPPQAAPPGLSAAERHKILVEWNRTERDYPKDKCIHQLFEEQVERSPEAVAVVFEGQSLTYRELNVRANRLAHHLRGLGVGPEVLVGLCVERSLEMVVGLLGILKAGGAYVPLDPEYPRNRLEFMLEDTETPLVVTREKRWADLPENHAEFVFLDEVLTGFEGSQSEFNPVNNSRPGNLAYVIYTSGSTGKPKGVLITHHNVVRLMLASDDWFQFSNDDVWTLFHSYAFDFSVWEIWGALLYGGRLVVVPYLVSRSPLEFLDLLATEKVTVLNQTPSAFRQLIEADQAAATPHELALRYIIFGGEALEMRCLGEWFERRGDERPKLINMYGITETTVHVTYRPLTKLDVGAASVIGVPIPDLQVYILDPSFRPVSVGEFGEMFVGGAGLARGYLNRPELTSERFILNPFSESPEARLYKTGDLARFLPDGGIEYLGRMDQQVKIRGHRIELGEVEAMLNGHPQIRQGIVVARDDHSSGTSLVAYIIPIGNEIPTVAELRVYLKENLPDYMIPFRFIKVLTLPLSPTGKLDRKALEFIDGPELPAGTGFLAPRSNLEHELVKKWQDVLGGKRVGIRDNFFDLGGHSLLAAVLSSKLSRRWNVEVPLQRMFEHPTVEELAGWISSSGHTPQNVLSIEKADRSRPLPMSYGQQRMWMLQQTLPDPATYNEPVAFRVSGKVEPEKIRNSLKALMQRHEILRTGLVRQGEDLLQQIEAEIALPWVESDLRAIPSGERPARLEASLIAEARRSFDLARAPLWRVLWVKLSEDEHVLALTFHHGIVDEWSLRLLIHELKEIYSAGGNPERAGLPELPVQYADYAAWQRRRLAGELLELQRDYWEKQLLDLPVALELPVDRVRPARSSGQGAVHDIHLDLTVVSRMRELAREESTTLFTVMLAAFQVWLHRYTGQTDLVVGTPVANRERPEVQSLLGFFLNTLPIRARLDGSPGFREVLRQTRDTLLDGFSHADLPFEQMVEVAAAERGRGDQPLYQVMFVLVEEAVTGFRLGQAEARPLPVETGTSKNDLTWFLEPDEQGWKGRLEYSTDLFTAETAARMGRHLTELLRSITVDPELPICRLNLMPEEERHQVLVEWNRTERDYPKDKCIHQLFEEQVERSPEAVAVVFEGQSLTYRELNLRGNRLAHHLRGLGVGPEVLVGLCVERSLEMVVGLLGILKAGGAYWALEENLPDERLRMMLADAKPRLLLARGKSVSYLSGLAGCDSNSSAARIVVAAIEDLELRAEQGEFNAPPVEAGDAAYVSYTSGSTGRPKGVVVSHRGVARLVKNPDYVSLGPEETLLQLSPLSFDASTFEVWGALLNGGRLVMMPPGPPALAAIGELIRRQGVTTLWLTAGLFHLMAEDRLDDLLPLRQLLAGGDTLSPERVRRARRALPDCKIINGYGPTENTTFTCCHEVREGSGLDPSVPIGRPITNTRVYLLDSRLEPVPLGVAGELYAGGDGVALGYLHQPELTAERFIPDPFSGERDARLYRTGDLARWRPDGNLEFLGRMDHQVKIRGFRIELGEIETLLAKQAEIREAVVMVSEDLPGDKRLIAYLVAAGGNRPDVLDLRARLGDILPNYMVPSAFVWLDGLPLTPNGKVDRKVLPEPETKDNDPGEADRPHNMLELELVRIWQRIFQREDIGRHDNFFERGGHSLLAARLVAAVETLLGHHVPIATLFQSPTIESLARRFADENWVPPWSSLVPLQPEGSRPPLYFVHGWGGDVFVHLSVAKLLPADQPSYGIQAVGLDGRSARHTTVEEMAAHYVKEIISFQPEGPIHLAGYSMGGVIAYEVARQLHRSGRRVGLLALVDSAPLSTIPWTFYLLSMFTHIPGRLCFHFRNWMKLSKDDKSEYLRGRVAAFRHWLFRNHRKAAIVTMPAEPSSEAPQVPGFADYYVAVASTYVPAPYPGPADVLVGSVRSASWKWWYWKYYARGRVFCHKLPGNHEEIVSPEHLPMLARALAEALERARE